MKGLNKFSILLLFSIYFVTSQFSLAQTDQWKGKWISLHSKPDSTNSWICYRKDFTLDKTPSKAVAKIAVDTKYWLWVNGKQIIFEGGLKRGPNPDDTYYDEADLTKFLRKGKNNISILTWFFGKDGFSHKNSGKAGLLFQCIDKDIEIISDGSWKVLTHPSFGTCGKPMPNYRLAESSLKYDARTDPGEWYSDNFDVSGWKNCVEIGIPPVKPWNNLQLRPIPQWKNYGLNNYRNKNKFPFIADGGVIVCELPANMQVTPYLSIEAEAGQVIDIRTDDFNGGGEPNVRAEYITKKGGQDFECYGWMNGHKILYTIPNGVKVLKLMYRQTGFNTEFAGSFKSNDEFLNNLWKKAQRTLYITMRDNYFDCPDRERALWWGDAVNEGGEAYYALSVSSHSLFRKGMYELINWQRQDSVIFSPVPAGNWKTELPSQMLASVGYAGFWNYYLNTGDVKPLKDLFEGIKKYLAKYKLKEDGTVVYRPGDWAWGDWGDNVDVMLLENEWYYYALRGAYEMAGAIGNKKDSIDFRGRADKFKAAFNKAFWNGTEYRHVEYKKLTDDRAQALAVVSGLAEKEKFEPVFKVLQSTEFASPYMEKYVLESLFIMGKVEYGIERMKKRFGPMVNNKEYTTLFEGWGIGKEGFGGGTYNHAWSGGGLTILSQYLCGIAPIEPGYKRISIIPHPGSVKQAEAVAATVKGKISSAFLNEQNRFVLTVSIPVNTRGVIGIPDRGVKAIKLGGIIIWENGKFIPDSRVEKSELTKEGYALFNVKPGSYRFEAVK